MNITALFWIVLTIGIYLGSLYFYKKTKWSFLLPVFFSTAVIICILIVFNIPFSDYHSGAKWIDYFLGPAIVALSFPLYLHRKRLLKILPLIFFWLTFAAVLAMFLGTIMLWLLDIPMEVIKSMLLRNTTAAIAIELAYIYGGIASFTAAICTISGMVGAITGPFLFKKAKVSHSIAKGIAMGATAHAIGTARLMETDDEAGAISTLSFLLMAVVATCLTPLFIYLYS
ncbi:LrgB family protein [Alkalihalobacillus sp. 1P02AB]|uniref:LrgB family protein n=1 Tax=Alkalihalobacillus sp. 1P02AB TaxID=3132260 RepID=UPI0039A4FB71